MPGFLIGALIACLSVATLLPTILLVEHISGRERYSLISKLPGSTYVILYPMLAALLCWPLSLLWAEAGVGPILSARSLHPVVAGCLLVLTHDFLRYWEHRFEHRYWWPVHAVHHSPTELHAGNSYAHPLQAVPEFLIVSVPLSLVDWGVGMVGALGLVIASQNLLIHAPLRVHAGPLLRLFYVDNHFHRIHHSIEERHWHHNFGLTFSLWDRLFGTAIDPQEDEWPETGVPGVGPTVHPAKYLLQPLGEGARQAALITVED